MRAKTPGAQTPAVSLSDLSPYPALSRHAVRPVRYTRFRLWDLHAVWFVKLMRLQPDEGGNEAPALSGIFMRQRPYPAGTVSIAA